MATLHLFNVRDDYQGMEEVSSLPVELKNVALFRVAFGPETTDRGLLLYSETSGDYQLLRVETAFLAIGAGQEEAGWTSFMAFISAQGQPCILMYNVNTGDYKFAGVEKRSGSYFFQQLSHGNWGTGWTTFLNYYPEGRPSYMAYKQGTGDTAFCRLTETGDGEETLSWQRRDKGHTSFMSYRMNGRYHFLSYSISTGDVHFCELLEDGYREVMRCNHGAGWQSFMSFREFSYLAYGDSQAALCTITHEGWSGETTHLHFTFGDEWSHFVCPNWSESATFAALKNVVGISGPSRAGKGTLVQNLLQRILGKEYKSRRKGVVYYAQAEGATVSQISQDYFFDQDKIYGELHGNWEEPEAVNHTAVLEVLQREAARQDVRCLLFEGYQAFYDESAFALLDIALWLDISKQEAKHRRMTTKRVTEEYYEQLLWPAHERYVELVWSRPSAEQIHRIDAEQPDQDVADQAWEILSARLTPV